MATLCALTPGNNVGTLRAALGLSQKEMAAILGVTRGTVEDYEKRADCSPPPALVKRLAERYALPLAWFYDSDESKPPLGKPCAGEREALAIIADRLALVSPDDANHRAGETPEAYERRVRALVSAALDAWGMAAAAVSNGAELL